MGFESKITAASQVSNTGGVLFFITGFPGVGKTTLISTICDIPEYSGHLLILSAGGGVSALSDRDDIAVSSINKWSEMEEARSYLSKRNHPYEWVSIDLTSEVYNICLAEIVEDGKVTKEGRATLEARGIANDRFVQMIRDYRVLAETTGINVIFTSHATETKDEDRGMILVRANLTPGTLSTVLGIVDVAAYLEIRNKKRQIYLIGNERIWAKTRVPRSYGDVPEVLKNPTFKDILAVLNPQKEVV